MLICGWLSEKVFTTVRLRNDDLDLLRYVRPRLDSPYITFRNNRRRILSLPLSSSGATALLCLTPGDQTNRIRRKMSLEKGKKEANIISRTVPITSDWSITVWELENPSDVVETYWEVEQQGQVLISDCDQKDPGTVETKPSKKLLDPFGLVVWPGSVVAAQELLQQKGVIENKRVLILGAGVGVEAQAAAQLGASYVLATDIHPTTLKLLEYGSKQSGYDRIIETAIFDITMFRQKLPLTLNFDVIIIADVLYNDQLASCVARRCQEARSFRGDNNGHNNQQSETLHRPPIILISDSQRFVHSFERELNQRIETISQEQSSLSTPFNRRSESYRRVEWITRSLPRFTGSGVLINDDQTYDVNARILWIGLDDDMPTMDE